MTQRLMTQDGDNVILLAEMSCELMGTRGDIIRKCPPLSAR